jgi:hypothetical protein
VVDRLEVEIPGPTDLAQRDVVLLRLTVGRARVRQVGEGRKQLVAPLARLGELRLELPQLSLERGRGPARLLDLGIVGLAPAGGLLDLAGELVLLGPDRVDPGVELPPAPVGSDELVQLLGGATPGQPRARLVGIAADLLQVERGPAPALRYGAAVVVVD